jgi:hypothetical protein
VVPHIYLSSIVSYENPCHLKLWFHTMAYEFGAYLITDNLLDTKFIVIFSFTYLLRELKPSIRYVHVVDNCTCVKPGTLTPVKTEQVISRT